MRLASKHLSPCGEVDYDGVNYREWLVGVIAAALYGGKAATGVFASGTGMAADAVRYADEVIAALQQNKPTGGEST